MLEYQLEHIISFNINVTLPEMIGPGPEGLRLNFYITGGEMTGPKVLGKVLPVGADWVRVRRDGVGQIDVRATLETRDGALIYTTLDGIADAGEGGYEKLLAGKAPPSPTRVRTAFRFETSHPQYLWLNRLHCLGVGEINFMRFRINHDVYAVR